MQTFHKSILLSKLCKQAIERSESTTVSDAFSEIREANQVVDSIAQNLFNQVKDLDRSSLVHSLKVVAF